MALQEKIGGPQERIYVTQENLRLPIFNIGQRIEKIRRLRSRNEQRLGNRPSSVLIAEQLTPYTMGALLALYEARIVFQGFCWNINSFDQESVQLGKVLADRLLAALSGEKALSADAPESSLLKAAGMAG